MVFRYPFILSKSEEQIKDYFKIMEDNGVNEREAMKALLMSPKLISQDLSKQIREINFYFSLYNKLSKEEVIEIFKEFPYLFCIYPDRIRQFNGSFKKFMFTKEQII